MDVYAISVGGEEDVVAVSVSCGGGGGCNGFLFFTASNY